MTVRCWSSSPSGTCVPPDRSEQLARGAGWLAAQAPADLVPVALRVTNRGHQHAEALLDLGRPVTGAELAPALSAQLRDLDQMILTTDPRLPPPGFERVVPGASSWDERISRWSGRAGG